MDQRTARPCIWKSSPMCGSFATMRIVAFPQQLIKEYESHVALKSCCSTMTRSLPRAGLSECYAHCTVIRRSAWLGRVQAGAVDPNKSIPLTTTSRISMGLHGTGDARMLVGHKTTFD